MHFILPVLLCSQPALVQAVTTTTAPLPARPTSAEVARAALAPAGRAEATDQGSRLHFRGRSGTLSSGLGVESVERLDLGEDGPVVVLWSEPGARGPSRHYAISRDGETFDVLREARHRVLLRNREFEPEASSRVFSTSPFPPETVERAYVVQFVTQPLQVYRDELEARGVRIERFLAHQCQIVRATPSVADSVAALPFVRWVGEYRWEDRLERVLLDGLAENRLARDQRYMIQVMDRGLVDKQRVAEVIRAGGGRVDPLVPEGFFLVAAMSPETLHAVAGTSEVLWIDRRGEVLPLMNLARELGGANALENTLGLTGQGVRGEVLDVGTNLDHQEFQHPPLLQHTSTQPTGHGTATTSIAFATGIDPQARGMLPAAQGIMADVSHMGDPYTHRDELVDPNGPYRAVFQSNSWGWLPLTRDYTNRTAEVDDLVVQSGLLMIWGQGNMGTRWSLQEAWAKNLISVGGFEHQDTLTIADDTWNGSGSIGPAADGRIKPDLTAFYDHIYVASSGGSAYNPNFGGTSGATPIVAGHCGLFFQLWHEGAFADPPQGADVFESRPSCLTAKAVMINTATPFDFSGTSHDFARRRQGWGRPDLQRLLDRRDRLLVVDESDVLTNLDTTTYDVQVSSSGESLRATLCYLDVAGTTSSSQHRVNDLTLKLTSPTGVVWWGNNGLRVGNASTPGGSPNTIDTVENVFVEAPELGWWTVEVIASEVNADTHLETAAIDADYALVVSGIACSGPRTYCTAATGLACGTPAISAIGTPSATATSGYVLSAGPARGQAPGILFYGRNGSLEVPFLGGTLCVRGPQHRSIVVDSGGTAGNCDGWYSLDRNAFARGLLGGNPEPFLSTVGTTVYTQWWGRDTSAGGSFLSDAVVDVICP